MCEFTYDNKWEYLLSTKVVIKMLRLHEYRGFMKGKQFSGMEEISLIQSTLSSNRIGGISTTQEREKKLALDKLTPKTDEEWNIAGYRDLWSQIRTDYPYFQMSTSGLLEVQRKLFIYVDSSSNGFYQSEDKRSSSPPSSDITIILESLFQSFNAVYNDESIPILLLIPMFIQDFLYIQPFKEGNGRISRLLTHLLLLKSGFYVSNFISLEHWMYQERERYDLCLRQSKKDKSYAPFVDFFLDMLLSCYRKMEEQIPLLQEGSKSERVADIVRNHNGVVTKAQILNLCPDISETTVQRTLLNLQKEEKIEKVTGGRYASYLWLERN